jgi:selenocysteine-specific elongation factor
VAVNLAGLSHDQVARGDLLTQATSQLHETFLLDAKLHFAPGHPEPETGTRVHIHHGTRESPARLTWLGGAFWQLRLERPLIAVAGDRLVVRHIAPPDTLGGGRVLDAHPRRHGPGRDLLARLSRLARGEPETEVEPAVAPGTPASPPTVSAPLSASALALEVRLREAAFEPPPDSELDPDELNKLRQAGRVVRIARNLHYHVDALAAAQSRVIELAREHGGAVTLAQLRDALGTSRKFAQAVLEHLDGERVTIRRGEEHVVRRRHLDG